MSIKEQLKAEGKREREKLKQMTWGDRLWYIWEYYKLHMLALAAIFFVLYLIGNMIYNSTFTTQLSYLVINNTSTGITNFEAFDQEFKESMGYGKKDRITSDDSIHLRHLENGTEIEYANMAKISAMVATGDLDLMISDPVNIDHYMELEAFMDLQQLLPDDLWEQVKDSVYYAKDSQGQSIPCGIDLSLTSIPEKTGIAIEPGYISVMTGTTHADTILSWIRFVLQPQ